MPMMTTDKPKAEVKAEPAKAEVAEAVAEAEAQQERTSCRSLKS